jgi:hypothetical protein
MQSAKERWNRRSRTLTIAITEEVRNDALIMQFIIYGCAIATVLGDEKLGLATELALQGEECVNTLTCEREQSSS